MKRPLVWEFSLSKPNFFILAKVDMAKIWNFVSYDKKFCHFDTHQQSLSLSFCQREDRDKWQKYFHIKSQTKILFAFSFDVEMVFSYQNCSDLLREKIVLEFEKNFWYLRLKAKNLQKFWDHFKNLFKQWKFRTISGI